MINFRALLLATAAFAPLASASVASFGPTNQALTLTGLGGDALGNGVVRITWGTCVFDGVNTVCTVSAPFTGIDPGGTVSFVLTYQGDGPSPLTSRSQSPGNDFLGFAELTSGSFTATFTESNGTTLKYDTFPFFLYNQPGDGTATCTGSPTACSVGQVGLKVGSTITGKVSGSFDLTPIIRTSQGVISAGAFGAFSSIAPAGWIEIYGSQLVSDLNTHLWDGADFRGVNAPTTLRTTTVTIGGKPAYIDYVSPIQVNAQVPTGVPTGLQPVVVTTAGGSSLAFNIQVNAIQPGFLAPPSFVLNGRQYVVAQFPDNVTYVLPPGVTQAVPTRRAKPGDTLIIYGVGFGPVTPTIPAGQIEQASNQLQSPLQIFFNGTPAPAIPYYGLAPTFVGLYQFNVVVPNIAANDAVALTFSVGTTPSTQSMIIAIGN